VSQWEDTYCERRGLLKLDILGIKALDIFKMARKLIKKRHGDTIDIRELDLDDKKVLKQFAKGNTEGVFQFNSNLQSNYLKQLRRVTFEDLITTNAVLRPGPMDANAHNELIKIKQGEEDPHYDHPVLKKYLGKTYGLYIYQEDVMRTANVLGNLTLAEADIMRSSIKKKDKTLIDKFEGDFVKGCVAHGLKESVGAEIWKKLLAFSTYGFNRSHSASYALLGYFCQWIKVNYPGEFWTATLEFAHTDEKKPENVWSFKEHIDKIGIPIYDPVASRPNHKFHLFKKGIAWPIKAIKGIGIRAATDVATACKVSKPKTLEKFFQCVPKRTVNKKIFKLLIAADAFRNYGTQKEVADLYYRVLRKEDVPDELKLDSDDKWEDLKNDTLGYAGRSYKERYSGWFSSKVSTYADLERVREGTPVIMGGKVTRVFPYKTRYGPMKFVTVKDSDGVFEAVLLSDFVKKFKKPINVGDIVEVMGVKSVSKRGDLGVTLRNTKVAQLEIYDE
jgi:DNA polymerase III alpha subunit